MSSGSGLGSWFKTPISMVSCLPGSEIVSDQAPEVGALAQKALKTTACEMAS
jgi:hypothetical protein